ncbi:PorV/PorQ family protein [Capillibacterium thermochitinicola]|uniref:PorV/PorQ family protein n=1 Tax=Capillibacterium thermochitinicola TaxID=2699427 RepID=A0A8J6I1Z1_9FIRM|nr:hypothetical protein [Capillibacterium thermochitinicola]MBA2133946.1 hypothetical protein [Capillibacterium thermochitinicola]
MKKAIIIDVLCKLLLMVSIPAQGCVGSRPLGMGGAFISLADSVEAVYWNPAGLTQIDGEYIHFTLTVNEKDQMGYRSFFAFNKNFNNISAGFSYITRLRSWNVLEEWYVVSLARKINRKTSVGINGRYEVHSNGFTDEQIDLCGLYNLTDQLRIGFLYQSINNFRPSISYRINNNTVICMDIYNALHNRAILSGEHRIMWGIESLIHDVGIRLGMYAGDWTFGVGYKSIDMTVMNRNNLIILLGFTI